MIKIKKNLYVQDGKIRKIYIAVIFCFFIVAFTSNMWMPSNDEIISTPIGIEQQLENSNNRAVIIYSAEYSAEQETLEVIMELKNYNYDGKNEYHYGLVLQGGRSKDNEKSELIEVIHDSLVSVLHVNNLKSFTAVNILIAPNLMPIEEVPKEMINTLTFTQDNIKFVDTIKERSKIEYLAYRSDYIIGNLEDILEVQINKSNELFETISALEKENKELAESMEYVSGNESAEMKKIIRNNEEKILREKSNRIRVLEEIDMTKAEIEENKKIKEKLISKKVELSSTDK